MSTTIELVSATLGNLSSSNPSGPSQQNAVVDIVLNAPWAEGEQAQHVVFVSAVADVQMTFGFTEPLDAVDHIVRTSVAERMAMPSSADEEAAWRRAQDARTARKLALWESTHQFGLKEADLTPLTTHAEMYRTIFSIVAPPEPGGSAQAADEAKAMQDAQKAALDEYRSFYGDYVIDTASQGWKDLQGIFGSSAKAAAEDDPRAGNFLVRYGSAVHRTIGLRLQAEGLPVDPPIQPGV